MESEKDIVYRGLMTLGTLLFRDKNVTDFANMLEIDMVLLKVKQTQSAAKDVIGTINELLNALQNPDA